MKVIHVLGGYHPDPMAGTEVYVEGLAAELQTLGVESVVVAAANRECTYTYNNLRVRRFRMNPVVSDICEIYGTGDDVARKNFDAILDEERPDIVHFHTKTRAASLSMVRGAKTTGAATIVTYHTPTMSCPRGTLLKFGRDLCDGVLEPNRCAKCVLMDRGLGEIASGILSQAPAAVGRMVARNGLKGKYVTALRIKELMAVHSRTTREFYAEADRVVVLCNWARNVLLENGVQVEKLSLVRHGINLSAVNAAQSEDSEDRLPARLRIAFVGRIEPIKGVHLLIEAIRKMSDLSIQLDIYGVNSSSNFDYRRRIELSIAPDPRIQFLSPVPNDRIISTLRQYDALCVPSQWLETGPLVVLEAFAAGIPVIGSNLGGIAELVTNEVDGLLIDPFSEQAWRDCLRRINISSRILDELRVNVRPPRSMQDVAAEMKQLYEDAT